MRASLVVILAAGEGTRMRSARPKVLHPLGGRPLIAHVLSTVAETGGAVAAVVGPGHEDVATLVRAESPGAEVFVQSERRGTAHAALAARAALARASGPVVVVFGDTPLVTAATLRRLGDAVDGETAVAVLGFRPADPHGYGRLVMADGELLAIREDKDASETERAITLCNAGAMALDGSVALAMLDQIDDRNAKREF